MIFHHLLSVLCAEHGAHNKIFMSHTFNLFFVQMSDEGVNLTSGDDGEHLIQVETGEGVEEQQQNLSSVRIQNSNYNL